MLGRISAAFLSINFPDDLLNPPELPHLPGRSNFHRFMVTNLANLYGHETLNHPTNWASGLWTFLARAISP